MTGALILLMPVGGASADGEVNRKLRATIQQWVEVMKSTQVVQQEWKRDKQVLGDSREALDLEIKQLEGEIAAARERIAAVDSGSADKLERKRTYEEAREALRVGLDEVEREVSEVIPLLPKELAELAKVEAAIQDHQRHADGRKEQEVSLNKRLNTMLTILAEAEKFNQTVQAISGRSMAVDGERLLLDVVYFGLSLGYAVDEAGTVALQLSPTELGWTDRRLAPGKETEAVRELMDVAHRIGEASLVSVPVTVGE